MAVTPSLLTALCDSVSEREESDIVTALIMHDEPLDLAADTLLVGEKKQKQRLSRFVNRRCKGVAKESVVEQFAAKVHAYFASTLERFTELTGKDITQAYDDEVGGHSCMTGSNSRFVKLYEVNPDKVSLLVWRHNNKSARCLLWQTNEGKRVADRVYPNSGDHIVDFKAYCEANDIIQRDGNSYPGSYDTKFVDGEDYSVTLKGVSQMPYMDTFHWGEYPDDSTFTVYNKSTDDCTYSGCGGEWVGDDRVTCCDCDDRVSECDVTYIEASDSYVCEGCLSSDYTFSGLEGTWIPDSDVVTFADTNEVCSENNAANYGNYCEDCDEWNREDYRCDDDGVVRCCSCHDKLHADCDGCGDEKKRDDLSDQGFCNDCHCERFTVCDGCSDEVSVDDVDKDGKCDDCQEV